MKICVAVAAALMMLLAWPALANDIGNVTWTENAAGNSSPSPNGWQPGVTTPIEVSQIARETMGAIKRWYNHINAVKTSTGTVNDHVLTYDVAPAAYVDGDAYTFIIGQGPNTGAVTLNVNGLGTTAVLLGSTPLAAGQLVAGRVLTVYYKSAGPTFQVPICAGGGTACAANTGTSGAVLGFLNGNNAFSGNNTHSGTEEFTNTATFAAVIGSGCNSDTPISATTYTLAAADLGKTCVFTSNSAVTVTIPASIVPAAKVASIDILQAGTAKVSVNGSAVSSATLISESGFTGTSGTAGNKIELTLVTVGAQARAYLIGSGS